eukprot:jgi/Tetstr1/444082/TSEL_003320.t1
MSLPPTPFLYQDEHEIATIEQLASSWTHQYGSKPIDEFHRYSQEINHGPSTSEATVGAPSSEMTPDQDKLHSVEPLSVFPFPSRPRHSNLHPQCHCVPLCTLSCLRR